MNNLNLILGLYDDPERQIQDTFAIDLYTSNIAVFGNTMSGKTTLLKTLLIRMHQMIRKDDEEIYILDFSNDLEAYKKLPYIRAYFDSFNEENIKRIFKIIDDKLSFNIKELPGKNFIQRGKTSKAKHVTFILDGAHALFSEDRYIKYQEELIRIARDGLSKGISVVFTANEPNNGLRKLLTSFAHIIAFDINKDLYSNIFSNKVTKPIILKGRGIVNTTEGNCYEFQAFFPYNSDYPDNTEEKNIQNVIESLKDEIDIEELNNLKLKNLTGILDSKSWGMYSKEPYSINNCLVAGLDYYSYESVKIDLLNAKTIAIYGKKQFGKTNLLKLILKSLSNKSCMRIVCFDDKRNELTDPQKGVRKYIDEFGEKQIIYSDEELANFISNHYEKIHKDVDDLNTEFDTFTESQSKADINIINNNQVVVDENKPIINGNVSEINTSYFDINDDNKIKSSIREDENGQNENKDDNHDASHFDTEEFNQKINFSTNLDILSIDNNDEYEKIIYDEKQGKFNDSDNGIVVGENNNIVAAENIKNSEDVIKSNDIPERYDYNQQNNIQPFTVFIIQNHKFYSKKPGRTGRHIISRLASYLTECENVLFIFSDVQKINDVDIKSYFNSNIRHAFLLDDIIKFLQSRGSTSIFNEYDENELKDSFGKNILGDGFYFNVEFNEIQKIKILKADDE